MRIRGTFVYSGYPPEPFDVDIPMQDEKTGWTEPDITINGTALTFAQAMTLRVAAEKFLMEMDDPTALGDDGHGRTMVKNYGERLVEILQLMHKHGDK